MSGTEEIRGVLRRRLRLVMRLVIVSLLRDRVVLLNESAQ